MDNANHLTLREFADVLSDKANALTQRVIPGIVPARYFAVGFPAFISEQLRRAAQSDPSASEDVSPEMINIKKRSR